MTAQIAKAYLALLEMSARQLKEGVVSERLNAKGLQITEISVNPTYSFVKIKVANGAMLELKLWLGKCAFIKNVLNNGPIQYFLDITAFFDGHTKSGITVVYEELKQIFNQMHSNKSFEGLEVIHDKNVLFAGAEYLFQILESMPRDQTLFDNVLACSKEWGLSASNNVQHTRWRVRLGPDFSERVLQEITWSLEVSTLDLGPRDIWSVSYIENFEDLDVVYRSCLELHRQGVQVGVAQLDTLKADLVRIFDAFYSP